MKMTVQVVEHLGLHRVVAPDDVKAQWPPILRRLIHEDVEGRLVDGDIWPAIAVLKDGTVVHFDQAEDVGNGWLRLSSSRKDDFHIHTTQKHTAVPFEIRQFNVQVSEIAWLVEADS